MVDQTCPHPNNTDCDPVITSQFSSLPNKTEISQATNTFSGNDTININKSNNTNEEDVSDVPQINYNDETNSSHDLTENDQSTNHSSDSDEDNADKAINISIGFWNVEGLFEKLHLSDLCAFIRSIDIIGLGETFTLPNFDFNLKFPDHYAIHCPATKYSKLGRPSGGLVLLIRKSLSKYVEILDTQISHVIAIKISKKLFASSKDILLVTMYNHPSESIFYKNKDYYSTLEQVDQYIANSIEQGKDFDLIIGGDLNARLGDWAYTDDGEDDIEETQTTYNRISQDSFINNQGRTLIELCTTFGLTPLSGLSLKNFASNFTFIGHRGSSIVDHCLTSIDLLDHVIQYKTIDRVESNHLPIILTMESQQYQTDNNIEDAHEPYTKYRWQEKKMQESLNILNKQSTEKLLADAAELIDTDIDKSVNLFNRMLDKINNPMKQKINPKQKRKEKNEWFDKDCHESKKAAKNSLKRLKKINRKKNEKRYEARKKIYLEKKLHYNKLIKEKKKEYKRNTQEKLIESRNNSQKFWEIIKKITYKTIKTPALKIQDWGNYFCNLLNPLNQSTDPSTTTTTNREEVKVEDLDKNISELEIHQAIDKLKKGKAAGIDGISPELLKLTKPKTSNYLLKLFNKIYDNSYFPLEWMTSIIVPIHKKGSKLIMDNYRGISLLSLSSKIFTSILNTRLYSWLEQNSKICVEQAGFRRHYSTTDHIFTLYNMVNNCLYGNKRSKLYVVFVDYKKAFDLINREKLWTALEETGVSTKMVQMIKAIYKQVKAKVRFGNKLSDTINCPLGVKQGCLLSPVLFSILINKVAQKVAEKGRMGYQFINGGKEIFSLLFADDIVLISQTPAGLQNQINNLKLASEELGLEVNLSKTKSMIFRRGGYIGRTERWNYGREKIETVNSYKYLGYIFTTKLSTETALAEVAGKAKSKVISIFRALYKVGKIDINVFFHLFDSQVKPMLLYASEIWGNSKETITEKVQMFAARKLLGVTMKTPKTLIYGELNRYPLSIDSKLRTIKYWLKLQEMDNSRLPKQAYLREARELNNERSWGRQVKDLLEQNGYGYVWLNQGVLYKNSFLKSFKQRLIDQYWQQWHEKIVENDRFAKYREFKDHHQNECYLKEINVTKFRKIFTKLRFGILDIQTNKARFDETISLKCPTCKQEPEDELHLLLRCPSYSYLRQKYIHKHWPSTDNLKLSVLLNTQENNELKDLSMYIYYCMKRREYLTGN